MVNILRYTTLTLVALGLLGCGGLRSNNGDGGVNTNSSRQISPSRKVVAVVSRRQLLPNYLACTGLPATELSNQTRGEVDDALGKLAEEGSVSDISAPMMMAFVKVGAEICNDLIGFETGQANRKFFGGFDLNNNRANQTFDLSRTVTSLASSCWGRTPSSEEVSMVISNVSQTAIADLENRDMALYVCSAILGSSAAVKF